MAFWILPNTAGAVATSIDVDGSATTSGYDVHDLISGPRSRMWRCDPFGSVVRVYYNLPAAMQMTHCVIARADLMMTEGGTQIDVAYGSGSGTNIDGIGPPISAVELVGIKVDGKPHGQDAAFEFSNPVTSDVFQVAIGHDSGTQAGMLAKVYFSAGLLLGDGPQPGPTWSVRRDGEPQIVKPLLGYEEYAVTDAIAFRWAHLRWEEIEAFEASPLNWACFLFDTEGDIFAHRLEHVILTSYGWSRVGDESFTLETVWQRLAHYG
jgi:hypothetical protein